MSPFLHQEENDDFKSQENLVNGESRDINLHNLVLAYITFSGHFTTDLLYTHLSLFLPEDYIQA